MRFVLCASLVLGLCACERPVERQIERSLGRVEASVLASPDLHAQGAARGDRPDGREVAIAEDGMRFSPAAK